MYFLEKIEYSFLFLNIVAIYGQSLEMRWLNGAFYSYTHPVCNPDAFYWVNPGKNDFTPTCLTFFIALS